MTRASRHLVVLTAVALCAGAAPARAEWTITPPRPGQVGLSLQGQYGALLDAGSVGTTFGQGPGLAVRLRYRMRYERAMGLSFENQRFDARTETSGATDPKSVSLFAYGIDVYQMFGTRTRTARWVGVGAGVVQFRRTLNDGEIAFTSDTDGAYASVGAGVERFIWQSWALDLSGKYLSVFQSDKVNHDFQAAVGVIVYAAY